VECVVNTSSTLGIGIFPVRIRVRCACAENEGIRLFRYGTAGRDLRQEGYTTAHYFTLITSRDRQMTARSAGEKKKEKKGNIGNRGGQEGVGIFSF